MSPEPFPSAREACRLLAAFVMAGACSCARDLALPATPDGARPAFTLSPSNAFAGQPLVLQFSGPAVDLSRVTVSLAGQVVHPLASEATRLVVETPLVAGACERELHLEVDTAAGPLEPVVFEYLGAGHPGRPRPSVVRADRVSFVPSQFVSHGGGATVGSAYGTLMLKLTPDLEVGSAVHVDDFIAALSSLSEDGSSLVAWAGTFGTFGAVGVGLGRKNSAEDTSTPAHDYDTVLPSILYDGVSSLAASTKDGAVDSLRGLVLGLPGGPPPVKIDLAARASQSSAFPIDSALSGFPADAPVRAVIGRPSESWAAPMVRGGRRPAISVAGFSGRLSASTLSWESPVAVTPRALVSASAGDARYYLAVAWHADEPVGEAGGALAWLADDALMVVEVTAKQSGPNWPGKIERFGAVSTGRAVDAAAVYRGVPDGPGTLEVFTVDGEQPFLQRYSVDTQAPSLTPVLVETVPLGAVGWRVVAEPMSLTGPLARVTVVDRDGALHQLDLPKDGGPLRQVRVNRIPVGVASLSPRIGPSCSDAPAVLGAERLDSAVVMPLRGGSAPAFLPATAHVRAVEAIELARPDGQGTMTWFASGGLHGFQLDETIVQRRALTHAVGRVNELFETTALAVLEDGPTRAWLVAGGPDGMTAMQVTNGLQPDAEPPDLPQATATCPDVVQLVAAGERVVALSRASGGSRLCAYDPRTDTVVVGPVLPWDVRGLAAGIQRDRDTPAGQWHVFVAGREGGTRALVVATQTLAQLGHQAPTPLAWGPTVTDLLPGSDLPVSTIAVSPDARRLFIGFGGEHPGLLTVDPWLLAAPGVSEAERRESVTSLGLSGQPRAIGFTSDGARAIVVQEDDVMAVVE